MTLIKRIKSDLITAVKSKDEDVKRTIRVMLGEINRLDKKADVATDDEVIKIVTSLVKAKDKGADDDRYFEILERYLPKKMSEEELAKWIADNIDFSKLNNKMQAVGLVIKELGAQVDGKMVSGIIKKI